MSDVCVIFIRLQKQMQMADLMLTIFVTIWDAGLRKLKMMTLPPFQGGTQLPKIPRDKVQSFPNNMH